MPQPQERRMTARLKGHASRWRRARRPRRQSRRIIVRQSWTLLKSLLLLLVLPLMFKRSSQHTTLHTRSRNHYSPDLPPWWGCGPSTTCHRLPNITSTGITPAGGRLLVTGFLGPCTGSSLFRLPTATRSLAIQLWAAGSLGPQLATPLAGVVCSRGRTPWCRRSYRAGRGGLREE